MPKLIEALAVKSLRIDDEERRKIIFKRLSSFKNYFKGNDKNDFLNLLKRIKIQEELEKSNEEVVEDFIKNKNLMGMTVDNEEKNEMLNILNRERMYGLKAWKHALKEAIKTDFGLDKGAHVLWANDLIKKDKPMVYLWIIKLLDKSTRESRDNFIFRKAIKALNVIKHDEELEHVEKVNQIYEQLLKLNGLKDSKKTKQEIEDYKQMIRNIFDKQLAWKIFWIRQIKQDLQDQTSTVDLSQAEEVQLAELASSISKRYRIPFYEKEKKARRKMMKAIAQTTDIIMSNMNNKRYSLKELNEEFNKVLDSLTSQESTKDYKEVTIIKNQFTELIEMSFR